MNQFPSRLQVERLRRTYPPGTRLVLDQMEDGQAVAPGTRGTVAYEQFRSAKQRKQKLQDQEEDQTIAQTECLIETLAAGPEFLDTFDEELFCELIDKIIVDSNTKIRFRLKNGLELPESIERTVR